VFPQEVVEADTIIFQQDGAPAHYCAIVWTAVDEFLVNGLAGEGRLIGPHRVLTYHWWTSSGVKFKTSCTLIGSNLFRICTQGLCWLSLWCLWIRSLGCGVKWNFILTSVGLSLVHSLNCTKWQ
jgi:hypothetical protein